jgi:hypothetical protein|tara:strand:+ start:246 stop:425 length:180 start_codon:yes stop_codon:yes gene_type:complete
MAKMTKEEIEEYQKNIKPYVKGIDVDVTLDDVVIHGLVSDCVKIANTALKKLIESDNKE